ncbi:hypothetical protein ONZ45_g1478 [Pleurotus djamor]|nr:hypothetical protein ONZ45_g1478 [Pleurotus djamor]
MVNTANDMLNISAKPPSKWKHTKTLRGDEKRLAAALKSQDATKRLPPGLATNLGALAGVLPAEESGGKPVSKRDSKSKERPTVKVLKRSARPISLEKMAFEAGEDLFGEDAGPSSASVFTPGSFAECRRNQISTHGIVLYEEYDNRRWRVHLLTASGDVWTPLRDDIMFVVPNFISDDLLSRCGRGVAATDGKELNARISALKRLHDLERSVEAAYNKIQSSAHRLYDQVKGKEPDAWSTVQLDEAAAIVGSGSELVNTFAVHKYLMNDSLHYVAHPQYRTNRMFDVRPPGDIQNLQRVTTLLRESRLGSSPLEGFFKKAQGIITRHQQIRQQTRSEPPSLVPTKVSWTPDEQELLTFLLRSMRATRSTQVDPYATPANMLLKRIHPKLSSIHESVAHQTLVDLGVIPPWQDAITLPDRMDSAVKQLEERVAHQNEVIEKGFASSSRQTTSTPSPLGPEDFYAQDPLESVRHDFGDLPVFVIDDVTAQELDDGISVEAIPTEPGSHWVHVHIADPASVLPPNHIFAQEARKAGQTQYYLGQSQPMLPRALMEHGLSLGSSLRREEPQRVLTFSAKIDATGDIADYAVRAGIVRNVKVIDYDSADVKLGLPICKISRPFQKFEATEAIETPAPPPLEASLEPLKLLNDVTQRLIRRRMKIDTFNVTTAQADIRLRSPLPQIPITLDHPIVCKGFPDLDYIVSEVSDQDTGSRGIVAEMMKLACQVASKFASDRGLTLVRRTAGPPIAFDPNAVDELLKLRSPNGFVPLRETLKKGVSLASAGYSTEPLGHWGLGIRDGEGYCRVTSPLRRFSDLVGHWQIHSALLSAPPAFSNEWMNDYANVLASEDRVQTRREKSHKEFWKFLYIRHHLENPSPHVQHLLNNLEAEIVSTSRVNTKTLYFQCKADIPALGVQGFIGNLGQFQIVPEQIGTSVRVAIEQICVGSRTQMELRLVEK